MEQYIPLEGKREQRRQREYGRAARLRQDGPDPSAYPKKENDQHEQDQVFCKRLACRQRNTIPETTAFPHFSGQVSIPGKKSEKNDQQQQQPAKQSHPPAQQNGHTSHYLKYDHHNGKRQGKIIQPMKIPYFKKLLHLIAQSHRAITLYQSGKDK